MTEAKNHRNAVARIREQARDGNLRLTLHAHQEMVEEELLLEHLFQALSACDLVETYPDDRRGPSCLVLGYTANGRPIHLVCTTEQPTLIVITVYEPRPPKWVTPTQRRQSG